VIRPRVRPRRDPGAATERRISVAQVVLVVGASAVGLWLLDIGVGVVIGMETALVALLLIRLFGPEQMGSDQEFALNLAARHADEVVTSLRDDPVLRRQYVLLGLRADELVALPPAVLARSASILRDQGGPGRRPFGRRQQLVALAVSFAAAAAVAAVVSAQWPVCPSMFAPLTVVILIVACALGVGAKVVIAAYNNRVRSALRRHLDQPGAVRAEMAFGLAPVWSGRRRALVDNLNEICRIARPGSRPQGPVMTAVAQRVPYALQGTILALPLMLVLSSC
jgi:hypothetical protein